jgi:hypothetical protein
MEKFTVELDGKKVYFLTQIAFGITGVQTNPDFIPIMEYCREIGIIPNFTLSGIDLTDELAVKISKLVGALAVSVYETDKNVGYNTIKKFTDLGMKQVNIHLMVSEETIPFVYEVINDRVTDPRLANMNAIVFLGVKPKGRASNFHPLKTSEYAKLIEDCFSKKIAFGFDSCSAPKFEETVRTSDFPEEKKKELLMVSESCESTLFSCYINVHGQAVPCSFAEGVADITPVNVLDYDSFLDVWNSGTYKMFREKLLAGQKDGCRFCPIYKLD